MVVRGGSSIRAGVFGAAVLSVSAMVVPAVGAQEATDPQLSVAVDPVGTVVPSRGPAVVTAEVACDVATPVSAQAVLELARSDEPATVTVDDQPCAPGDPAEFFFSFRDLGPGSVTPGDVTVAVDASPTTSYSDDASTTAVEADVTLGALPALRAAVVRSVDDPDAEALREALREAIRLRAAQDPAFAAEFRAARPDDPEG